MGENIAPAGQGRGLNLLAIWLSRVFHPFTISLVVYWAVMYLAGTPALEALLWTVTGLFVVIVPLLMVVLNNVRRGRFTDMDVSTREHRYGLYVLAIACFALLIAILNFFEAPPVAISCLYAAAATLLVGAVLNRTLTKISLHAAAMGGCAAMLFFVSPPAGALLGLIALLVGWSRIHLNRHTPGQVLLGWLVAVLCTVVVFPLTGR